MIHMLIKVGYAKHEQIRTLKKKPFENLIVKLMFSSNSGMTKLGAEHPNMFYDIAARYENHLRKHSNCLPTTKNDLVSIGLVPDAAGFVAMQCFGEDEFVITPRGVDFMFDMEMFCLDTLQEGWVLNRLSSNEVYIPYVKDTVKFWLPHGLMKDLSYVLLHLEDFFPKKGPNHTQSIIQVIDNFFFRG